LAKSTSSFLISIGFFNQIHCILKIILKTNLRIRSRG
jgi:hypothetical protein